MPLRWQRRLNDATSSGAVTGAVLFAAIVCVFFYCFGLYILQWLKDCCHGGQCSCPCWSSKKDNQASSQGNSTVAHSNKKKEGGNNNNNTQPPSTPTPTNRQQQRSTPRRPPPALDETTVEEDLDTASYKPWF